MTEASKGYVSLFDLGESKDDVEVDYNSLYMHHYKADSASGQSTPDTIKPREVLDEVMDPEAGTSPFRPSWIYGFNPKLPVHSLFTLKDQFIAFAGSIHVVIMDIKKKEQHILEGHRNNISCLARSHSGSYLASGDTGPDQHSVLVWSVISKRPVLRMTSPHGAHGVESVQFTCDDKWLVTVGGSHSNQSVCVWDWKNSPESPVCCVPMKAGKLFSSISCHPAISTQFLVSSKTTVTFFSLDPATSQLLSHNPGSVEKEFGIRIMLGSYIHRKSKQVFSATTRGNIVVWLANGSSEAAAPKWKPSRLLRLEEEGISAMAERDGFLAVADTNGNVTFFNEELQKLKWTQNFSTGRIMSVSFHLEYDNFAKQGSDTILGDFLVSFEGPGCGVVSFASGELETVTNAKGSPWTLHDVHPVKNIIILGNIFGLLVQYNYLSNERISENTMSFEDEMTCIRFSVCGSLVAVGTRKGNLWLLKAESLEPARSIPFAYSKGSIRAIEFSECGEFLATVDTDRCVSVFRQNKLLAAWELLGRYRGHSRPILQIMFGRSPETGDRVLVSLGKDMKMNEYDLETSSISEGLMLSARTEVEQRCQPTCAMWHPPTLGQEAFIVIANKHQKQRLVNMSTKMCRKVVAGPANTGKHVSRMLLVPGVTTSSPMRTTEGYLLSSSGSYLTLQKLPLTGAPSGTVKKLANPRGLDDLLLSSTGKYCFTFNKEDESFTQWHIDPLLLEDGLAGDDKSQTEDFLSTVPESINSKLYKDMKDLFCYVQIEKGAKSLSKTIPIEDIVTLCRALGYYPTEKETEDMMNEVRYTDYVNSGKLQTDICLDEFLKLFMNHKSTKGEEITELRKVFKIIGKSEEDPSSIPKIDRDDLINFLKSRGEVFKDRDFKNHVTPLFQQNLSIDNSNSGDEACEHYGIEESSVSYEWFTNDILKLKEDINMISGTENPSSTHQRVKIVVDEVEPSIKA